MAVSKITMWINGHITPIGAFTSLLSGLVGYLDLLESYLEITVLLIGLITGVFALWRTIEQRKLVSMKVDNYEEENAES